MYDNVFSAFNCFKSFFDQFRTRLYQYLNRYVFSMEEYIDLVIDCITLLPPRITIHRMTGDGPKDLLIAPLWSQNKRFVLNQLHKRFKECGAYQGQCYVSHLPQ